MPLRKNEQREAQERQLVLTSLGVGMGLDADQVVKYLVGCMVDGVRRAGSWERGVVAQLFGAEAVRLAAFELRRDEEPQPARPEGFYHPFVFAAPSCDCEQVVGHAADCAWLVWLEKQEK